MERTCKRRSDMLDFSSITENNRGNGPSILHDAQHGLPMSPLGAVDIYETFVRICSMYPGHIAIEWKDRNISFEDLLGMAHEIAWHVSCHDGVAGPLGVMVDNSPEQV